MSAAALTSGAGISLRNDYGDFVGFEFAVGSNPLYVSAIGRWIVEGNSQVHAIKITDASGNLITGASVSLATSGQSVGYAYASLSSPVTLAADTTYILASQEFAGGDQWYDEFAVTSTADLTIVRAIYFEGATVGTGSSGDAYVPPNFFYSLTPASTHRAARIGFDGGFSDAFAGGF